METKEGCVLGSCVLCMLCVLCVLCIHATCAGMLHKCVCVCMCVCCGYGYESVCAVCGGVLCMWHVCVYICVLCVVCVCYVYVAVYAPVGGFCVVCQCVSVVLCLCIYVSDVSVCIFACCVCYVSVCLSVLCVCVMCTDVGCVYTHLLLARPLYLGVEPNVDGFTQRHCWVRFWGGRGGHGADDHPTSVQKYSTASLGKIQEYIPNETKVENTAHF